jgi:hypothetical protein
VVGTVFYVVGGENDKLFGWRGEAKNWSELCFVVRRDCVLGIGWPAKNRATHMESEITQKRKHTAGSIQQT